MSENIFSLFVHYWWIVWVGIEFYVVTIFLQNSEGTVPLSSSCIAFEKPKPLWFLILYMWSLEAWSLFSLSSVLWSFTIMCFGGELFSSISRCTLSFFDMETHVLLSSLYSVSGTHNIWMLDLFSILWLLFSLSLSFCFALWQCSSTLFSNPSVSKQKHISEN